MYGCQMIVTGAFLAESATVVDNKLNVRGGVVDRFQVPPSRVVALTLVVLTQPEPFDKEPELELTMTGPVELALQQRIAVPQSSLGGTIGFVVAPLRFTATADGVHALSVVGHRGSATMPLTVIG